MSDADPFARLKTEQEQLLRAYHQRFGKAPPSFFLQGPALIVAVEHGLQTNTSIYSKPGCLSRSLVDPAGKSDPAGVGISALNASRPPNAETIKPPATFSLAAFPPENIRLTISGKIPKCGPGKDD